MNAVERIVNALRDDGQTIKEGTGGAVMATCPAHKDDNPSLSIGPRRNPPTGAVLHCHAGCNYTDILAKIGLSDRDLFDEDKILDVFNPFQTYEYAKGHKNHRKLKDGKKTFWQECPEDDSLFAVDRIGDAKTVFLCEGEKGANFLLAIGHPAVATGGSERKCDMEPMRDRIVMLIVDRDPSGDKWAKRLYGELQGIAATVLAMQAKTTIPKADIVEHFAAGGDVHDLVPYSLNGVAPPEWSITDDDRPDNTPVQLEDVELGFWDSRESLQAIWTTALARMCSPWAVLANCVARALTQVRPHVTLPPLIGGPGSLNWFGAIAAASGGGKGSSSAAARRLVPEHIECRNLGSGEGLIAAYSTKESDAAPEGQYEAVMFVADEVDTITALNSRSGSTMMSILRSGFSGETLGFSYAAKEKRRHLEAHTYRMTLVISVQPERAGNLFSDVGGGTPQRFMWFPGTDHRITANPPWEANPLELPNIGEWMYPTELTIPDAAVRLILNERVKTMRGETHALDGHGLFVREKFAFALAVLDGRTQMTMEDWELSGIAAAVSTHTRSQIVNTLQNAAAKLAKERGAERGIEMAAADVEREHQRVLRNQRVLRWLMKKLDEADGEGVTQSELVHKIAGRDRPALYEVLRSEGAGLARAQMVDGAVRWFRI